MLGFVRKIIPQSTVDGPGNRTAVFLQGCNLRCAYCHNPETWRIDLSFPKDKEVRQMSARAVAEEVKKGIPFIRGVTVSGGECMIQAEFVEELFEFLKPLGLSCLIDSNGMIPFYEHPHLLDLCDGVMLDVKAWDTDVHRLLTGSDNDNVKYNLHKLLSLDKLTEVRIVCLPKGFPIYSDTENILNNLASIPAIVAKRIPIKILRFRPHGVVGELSEYPMPSDKEMQAYYDYALQLKLNVFVV